MTLYLNRDNGLLAIIPIVAVVYMGPLYLFVVSTFFMASFVDPGIYPRGMLMVTVDPGIYDFRGMLMCAGLMCWGMC